MPIAKINVKLQISICNWIFTYKFAFVKRTLLAVILSSKSSDVKNQIQIEIRVYNKNFLIPYSLENNVALYEIFQNQKSPYTRGFRIFMKV